MTLKNNLTVQPIDPASLIKRMLIGAGIGLAVILSFVLRVPHPRPEWGTLWMLRPLLMVPAAGATGGAVSYFIEYIRYQRGWNKALAALLSLIVFIIGLWMGIVLGLVGTLWH